MWSEEDVAGWKDPDRSETGAGHPAGAVDLGEASGGNEARTEYIASIGCCNGLTTSPVWPCRTAGPYGSVCYPREAD